MIKMYKTSSWSNKITEKEFIEVSDKSVFWINERTGKKERELITSYYHTWHKSKEDAVKWLKNKYELQIKRAESIISEARKDILELDSI